MTQEPFISGYFPNPQKTILKLNTKGKIYLHEKTNQIEILYADINLYSKEIINNEKNFNLGDLNEKAFIFAYSGKEVSENEYHNEMNE